MYPLYVRDSAEHVPKMVMKFLRVFITSAFKYYYYFIYFSQKQSAIFRIAAHQNGGCSSSHSICKHVPTSLKPNAGFKNVSS